MKKQTMAILAVVFMVLAALIYQGFFKKEKSTFTLAEVVRGEISQEVSETGQVKRGKEIKLSFKNAGRIEKIYIEVGKAVKAGDILAKLETKDLEIQLQEAKAVLLAAQAKSDKLLAGASSEEIQVSQTEVENSQVSLKTAKQNLDDDYEDALMVLSDAYLKAYNASNVASLIQRTYFTGNDSESSHVKESKSKIETVIPIAKSYLDKAQADSRQDNIDTAFLEMKKALEDTSLSLKSIRETCEELSYRNLVSSTDKTSLDTQRTNINTALANIINSQQTITAAKISIETAEGQLQTTKDKLALVTAPPRQEDINLSQAQIDQAETQVQLLENKIEEAVLKSPIQGQITDVKKRVGELVQSLPSDVVVTILPTDPFEIEVDIYEEDVVKMKINNEVEISLVAFPGQTFRGKVVSIYPAEKLIEGVVYYKVIIAIEKPPEGIKPGMTADVVIQTASKDNVFIIFQSAIEEKDGKTIVKIVKGKNLEDREVQIGLKGSNDLVEVVSGLNEGETIAIPK